MYAILTYTLNIKLMLKYQRNFQKMKLLRADYIELDGYGCFIHTDS
jgi:hypothetical protein